MDILARIDTWLRTGFTPGASSAKALLEQSKAEIERLQASLTEIRDSTFHNSVQLRAMAQRLLETKTPPPAAAEMGGRKGRETDERKG